MSTLDCKITEIIQRDFNALWKCKKLGETVEISTPYLLPDATLFSVFITQKQGRYIVCDAGSISEILEKYCPLPKEEIEFSLSGMQSRFSMKRGFGGQSEILFFNECSDIALIGSLVFDLASFATYATTSLVSSSSEDEGDVVEVRDSFPPKADAFLRSVMPSGCQFISKHEIPQIAGIKFSAVIKSTSNLCIVSYITGSHLTYFRKTLGETVMNFNHAWDSSISTMIKRTIPILNTDAFGYQPDKLGWQIQTLAEAAHGPVEKWSDQESIRQALNS